MAAIDGLFGQVLIVAGVAIDALDGLGRGKDDGRSHAVEVIEDRSVDGLAIAEIAVLLVGGAIAATVADGAKSTGRPDGVELPLLDVVFRAEGFLKVRGHIGDFVFGGLVALDVQEPGGLFVDAEDEAAFLMEDGEEGANVHALAEDGEFGDFEGYLEGLHALVVEEHTKTPGLGNPVVLSEVEIAGGFEHIEGEGRSHSALLKELMGSVERIF